MNVIYTPNNGNNWYNITANNNFSNIKKCQLIGDDSSNFSSILVIVDEITVYATILDNIDLNNINSTVSWIDIGSKGLPNVGITDIVYSNTDDLLLISLHGRGVWKCLNFNKVFTTMNNQLLKSSYSIKDIIKPKYDNIGIGIIRPRESLDIIGNIRLGNNELLSTNIVPGIINSYNNFENFNGNNGKFISLS